MVKGKSFNESFCQKKCDLSTCINLDDAETIDLSGCGLKKIPSELNRSPFLLSLDMSNNNIAEISDLDRLDQLEYLNLGINEIETIENLDGLKSLNTLRLHDNEINKISGLEGLSNLERLDLRHNHIEWVEGLSNNDKLEKLSLNGNPLMSSREREMLNTGFEFATRGRELRQKEIAQYAVGISEIKDRSLLTKFVEGIRREIIRWVGS